MKVKPFTKEVKFQVGQRVHVDVGDRKAEGVITQIIARFASSPEARKIYYSVMFDAKRKYRFRDHIPTIPCSGDLLTAL